MTRNYTDLGRRRNGGDRRGSSKDRAARRAYLLEAFGGRCVHCGCELDDSTVQADRIDPGGSYARHNIQASCRRCNTSRSNNRSWSYEIAVQMGHFRVSAGVKVTREA